MSSNVVLTALFGVSSQDAMQRIKRHSASFVARQAHGRQWRLHGLCQVNVIEAHDGEILGHSQVGVMNRAQCSKCLEIIGSEHGGRSLLEVEEAIHSLLAAVDLVI